MDVSARRAQCFSAPRNRNQPSLARSPSKRKRTAAAYRHATAPLEAVHGGGKRAKDCIRLGREYATVTESSQSSVVSDHNDKK